MNEKYIFGLISIVWVISLVTVSVVSNLAEDESTSLEYHTAVCVYKNGELMGPCTHNLVPSVGLDYLKKCIAEAACGTPSAFLNISVGNCTAGTAAADVELCGAAGAGQEWTTCNMGPAAGTYVDSGTGAWNVTYTWTSNCDSVNVNSTALYNNSVSVMFAENTFNDVSLDTNDQLNVTWGIWVTSG